MSFRLPSLESEAALLRRSQALFAVGKTRLGSKSELQKILARRALNASDIRLGDFCIPQVTIKTGFSTPEGLEEQLTEYLCDQPDCPNVATHVLGFLREIGAMAAVCDEHAPKPRS
jgi:hypothetical protein